MSGRPAVRGAWVVRGAALASRVADYCTLAKARLSVLVLAATLAGYLLGSAAGGVDAAGLVHALAGTALVAWGAGALNQVLERELDGRMRRTADRPLPAGRMSLDEALYFGVGSAVLGVLYLWRLTTPLAAGLSALTLVLYLGAYTPLKRVTEVSLLAGAVPGAVPPLIGCAAAAGELRYEAWLAAGIVFFWQFPHFLAISWLYREDYARGGFAMLAVRDAQGRAVSRQVMGRSLAMVAVSLLPVAAGLAGVWYGGVAAILGAVFLGVAGWMCWRCDAAAARGLFVYSIVYLPLALLSLVIGRTGG